MTDEMKKAAEEFSDEQIKTWEDTSLGGHHLLSFALQEGFEAGAKWSAADAHQAGWTKCLETLAAKAGEFDTEETEKKVRNGEGGFDYDIVDGPIEFYVFVNGARWQHQQTALPLLAKIELLEKELSEQKADNEFILNQWEMKGERLEKERRRVVELHQENQFLCEQIRELVGR